MLDLAWGFSRVKGSCLVPRKGLPQRYRYCCSAMEMCRYLLLSSTISSFAAAGY